MDNIFSQGFIPLIHKPTRVTSVTATLIDHIYTNILNSESISDIILTDVADHFGTFHVSPKKRKHRKLLSKINVSTQKQILTNSNNNWTI